MKKFSIGQLRALSDFFNTLAAAWFTTGVIAPFFAKPTFVEKMTFFMAGLIMSYIFLNFSLFVASELKS